MKGKIYGPECPRIIFRGKRGVVEIVVTRTAKRGYLGQLRATFELLFSLVKI